MAGKTVPIKPTRSPQEQVKALRARASRLQPKALAAFPKVAKMRMAGSPMTTEAQARQAAIRTYMKGLFGR
jgi:hypothetical protein